jgi:phage shock protein PspC (stress-responsive transcriptional regulator)
MTAPTTQTITAPTQPTAPPTSPASPISAVPSQRTAASPRRWVGGVAASVAGRTNIPVGLIRIGWVAAVAILASAGLSLIAWVPVVCYAACWWKLAQKRTTTDAQTTAVGVPTQRPVPASAVPVAPTAAPVTAPAAAPAAAPATSPADTAEDTPERARLKDFVRYMWGTQPTPQPTYTADLAGVVLTGLQMPGQRDPGYYSPRMPFGKLYVYPEHMVFLTESHNKPGVVPPLSRMLSVLLDAWRVVGFWRPIPLARRVYRAITTEELDRLRKPLGNPNSIVVARRDITGVSVRKYMLTRYVVVHTVDRDIMLAPNSYLGLVSSFGFAFLLMRSVRMNFMGSMGLPWETALVRELQQTITVPVAH